MRDQPTRLLEKLFCATLNEWAVEGKPWEWEDDSALGEAEKYLALEGRFLTRSVPASFTGNPQRTTPDWDVRHKWYQVTNAGTPAVAAETGGHWLGKIFWGASLDDEVLAKMIRCCMVRSLAADDIQRLSSVGGSAVLTE